MTKSENGPKIIFVEDDPEQMDLLVQCALDEINKIIENVNTSESEKQRLDSVKIGLVYTSPSPRDRTRSRMPSSA